MRYVTVMARWSHEDYERLESAITAGLRVALTRLGGELVVVPRRLALRAGREALEAVHPATGEPMSVLLDEIERIEIVE
ncbi:MAG: hypothetical protein ACT4R6_07205 [Gemmatimonadaceae bacterium]